MHIRQEILALLVGPLRQVWHLRLQQKNCPRRAIAINRIHDQQHIVPVEQFLYQADAADAHLYDFGGRWKVRTLSQPLHDLNTVAIVAVENISDARDKYASPVAWFSALPCRIYQLALPPPVLPGACETTNGTDSTFSAS
jgi:hypothetical protein